MLKKFGSYFIGVGIVVTGVLWYERRDGVIAGEDMAEVIHQAMDIYLIGKLMGNDVPDYWGDGAAANDRFGSNLVKGAVISMDDLRRVALRVEQLPQWSNPVWIDPQDSGKFKDGATILSCTNKPVLTVVTNRYWVGGDAMWIDYEDRQYNPVTPTPISHVRTLASRAYNGAMPFERGVSPTNDPICRWLDGSAGIATDYAPWPSGSFWTTNMGSRAYTLPFKNNFTSDRYNVLVRPAFEQGMYLAVLSGGQYVATNSYRITFPNSPNNWGQVYVRMHDNYLLKQAAGLYDVFTPNGGVYSVAFAGPPPAAAYNLSSESGYAVEIPSWSPGTVRIRRAVALPANGVLRTKVIRSGSSSVIASDVPVYTNDTAVYDVPVSVYADDAAALLRVWLDVPGVDVKYTHVAIGSPPSPMDSDPIRLRNFVVPMNWTSRAGSIEVYPQIAPKTVTTVYDRVIRERNLDAIRAVLTNCTTSAFIAYAPFLSASYTLSNYYATSHESGTGATFGSGLGILFSKLDWQYTSSGDTHPGLKFRLYCNYDFSYEVGWDYSRNSFGYLSLDRIDTETLTLSYPSAFAVTNGLVSSIRVFAVYKYHPSVSFGGSQGGWVPELEYATGMFPSDIPVTLMPILSLADESSVIKTGDSTGHYSDNYNLTRGFREITLNEIYSCTSPDSITNLTFTITHPQTMPTNPGAPNARTREVRPQSSYGDVVAELLYYQVSVTIVSYVIVVDWNWPILH